jgi:hypothetical protein
VIKTTSVLVLGAASVLVAAQPSPPSDLAAMMTPAEARKLNESIRASKTISGRLAPAFSTTVVCGFVEETNAVCWQYWPASRAFIKIGEWQT